MDKGVEINLSFLSDLWIVRWVTFEMQDNKIHELFLHFLELKRLKMMSWITLIQGTAREGWKREGRVNAVAVLCSGVFVQLRLLHLPWIHLPNAGLSLLGMLVVSQQHSGPSARVGPVRAWYRSSWAGLVDHFLLPRKPTGEPMVCDRQRCRGIRVCDVRSDSTLLLVECVPCKNVPHFLQQTLHRARSGL